MIQTLTKALCQQLQQRARASRIMKIGTIINATTSNTTMGTSTRSSRARARTPTRSTGCQNFFASTNYDHNSNSNNCNQS